MGVEELVKNTFLQLLMKTKDVVYDKEKHEITSIPTLFFNATNKKFTLRVNEKHVSTLKSLTPKRLTEKNKKSKDDVNIDASFQSI